MAGDGRGAGHRETPGGVARSGRTPARASEHTQGAPPRSSPSRVAIGRPACENSRLGAPVAQLDRVPGYEPGGREFESLRARQLPELDQAVSDHSLTAFFIPGGARREHRSLAGQIEHWAELGRALEADLTAMDLRAVRDRAERTDASTGEGARLADVFAAALSDTARTVLARELAERTSCGTHAAFPGWIVRFEPNGACTPGRLVDREFVPAEALRSPRDAAC